jgi:hypothetical protein
MRDGNRKRGEVASAAYIGGGVEHSEWGTCYGQGEVTGGKAEDRRCQQGDVEHMGQRPRRNDGLTRK